MSPRQLARSPRFLGMNFSPRPMRESVTRFWQLRRFESFYLLRRDPGVQGHRTVVAQVSLLRPMR